MNFEKHLLKYLPQKEIDLLVKSFQEKEEKALYLNTNKMSEEKLISLFSSIEKHPLVDNGYYYNKSIDELGKSIYHLLGCYYIQEPSAMLVTTLLDPQPGEKILDLCAAPGGKSIQCALKMKNTGVLISNDLSHKRCLELLENIERMGISNTIVTNNDFSKICNNYQEFFDRIILDAPCSGSGMFRKNDAMIIDWTYEKVLKFAAIQKELILMAYDMLKEGGTLIYSTCSYSYEEDEEVISYLINERSNAKILLIPENEAFYVDAKTNLGIHLFPSKFKGEGHYICLISKGEKRSAEVNNFNNSLHFLRTLESIENTYVQSFNDTKFALSEKITTKGLNILRSGVNFSTLKGNNEIYSYHLAHAIDDFKNSSTRVCEINKGRVRAYTNGETLENSSNLSNGIVLLTYDDIPMCFGKVVNNQIKNYFPKYLRNKNYIE